ncbi:MAG TPA: GMC family oxidoreductase N-terminal domain-containing protein [Myxococcota bacterium]|jgi:choline dehydrogenase-like flavoprotein|nr:GMC family oxidoreductase N-terminal domain-containing protein [Myxococcota bacterium]
MTAPQPPTELASGRTPGHPGGATAVALAEAPANALAAAAFGAREARAACARVGDGRLLRDAADYVVIGSGAAGATAARALARAGADVLLVEEGPPFVPAAPPADVTVAQMRYFRDHGANFIGGRSMMPVLQGRCVGGSTAINSAITWRLPDDVYGTWGEDAAVAAAWPQHVLEARFEELERDLGVRPIDRAVLGRNNTLMEQGAHALGFDGRVIERNETGCRGSARCVQGCPNGAKQSMNLSFVPDAQRHGARLWTGCAVRRLVRPLGSGPAAARGWIVEADFQDFDAPAPSEAWGPAAEIHARRAVLVAASALQTPCLLRRSGLAGAGGVAGDYFTCHPGTAVGGVFDDPVRMWEGATQGWESAHFRAERFKLEAIALPPALLTARLPGAGTTLMHAVAEMAHVALWAVQIRPRGRGRVRPAGRGGFRARFDLAPEDVTTLRRAVRLLCEMMFAAGAREALPGIYGLPPRVRRGELDLIDRAPLDTRAYNLVATHLFGTARMGSDPASSVVAPRTLEHHDAPGVFVLDSSVFPTNLGVNPQHAIMAIAAEATARLLDRH